MNKINLKNNFEFFLFRSLSCWLRSMPIKSALDFHRVLGTFWFDVLKIRKKVTLENLKRAFPDKTSKELEQLTKKIFFHFSRVGIEHVLMPKFINNGLDDMIASANWEVLTEAYKERKGVIILSGHFGNWELLAASLSLNGFPTWAVAAQQRNLKVDKLINEHRNLAGLNIIFREQAKTTIPNIFKNGELLLLLCDQDAGKDGVFVPFFGHLASTPPGPAVFFLRNKIAIVYALAIYHKGKYILHFERLKITTGDNGFRDSVKQVTKFHVNRLEQDIRKLPEQWFWLHRRWKTSSSEVIHNE